MVILTGLFSPTWGSLNQSHPHRAAALHPRAFNSKAPFEAPKLRTPRPFSAAGAARDKNSQFDFILRQGDGTNSRIAYTSATPPRNEVP